MKGSHKRVNEKGFSCHWGGGVKKGKRMGGWEEGKDIVVIERFLVTTWAW